VDRVQWLGEIAFASAYKFGAWPGVIALRVFAAGLAFALLAQALARAWQSLPVAIALVAALELVAPHMLARPHVLAMPLMVGWIASLIRSNDAKRPPDWRLLPVMVLCGRICTGASLSGSDAGGGGTGWDSGPCSRCSRLPPQASIHTARQ
jgi:hypothetical protein